MVGSNFFAPLTSTVDVALTDVDGNARLIKCTVANLPTGAGYAIGCIAQTEAGALYSNTGTATVASFVIVSTVTAGSVTTAMIADANVTLAKLAAGITPSHIVKYAGTATMTNGVATKAASVSGVLSTDLVMATSLVNAGGLIIVSAVPTTDTVTITMSGNATTGDKVSYTVFRAVA